MFDATCILLEEPDLVLLGNEQEKGHATDYKQTVILIV